MWFFAIGAVQNTVDTSIDTSRYTGRAYGSRVLPSTAGTAAGWWECDVSLSRPMLARSGYGLDGHLGDALVHCLPRHGWPHSVLFALGWALKQGLNWNLPSDFKMKGKLFQWCVYELVWKHGQRPFWFLVGSEPCTDVIKKLVARQSYLVATLC